MNYTENLTLKKPAYGDNADVADLNYNADILDSYCYNNRQMEAPPYDPDRDPAYSAGEIVTQNGALYICNTDGTTGPWDATKWDSTTLSKQIELAKQSGGGQVTKEASGNPIELTDAASAPIVKCVTQITGSQDLHGQDKPWVGGAGKNKFDPESTSDLWVLQDGTRTHNSEVKTVTRPVSAGENVTLSNKNNSSSSNILLLVFYDSSDNLLLRLPMASGAKYISGTAPANTSYVLASFYTWSLSDEQQLEIGVSFPTDYAPYSNICPITAYTEGEIEVSDGDGNTTTHTTTYPSAIYRGSEDVVEGEVGPASDGSEWIAIDLSTLTWKLTDRNRWNSGNIGSIVLKPTSNLNASNCIFDRYETISASALYANETQIAAAINIQGDILIRNGSTIDTPVGVIAFELATPTTSSVTPTNLPLKTLSGYNHIESSTGEMEVEYITEGYQPLVDLIQSGTGHTYSTSEQVVGKWTDGRDLYERIIEFPNVTINGGPADFKYKGDLMVKSIISDADIILPDTQHSYYVVNSTQFSFLGMRANCNTGELTVVTLFAATNADLHICLQYTKTTQTRSLNTSLTSQKAQIEPLTDKTEEVPTEEEKAVNEEENTNDER